MLLLDRRIGSADLQSPLTSLGVPVEIVTLDFADCAFLGHGPLGEGSMQIGVEIKQIRDLLNSIQDGRFSGHQLPGLLRQFDVAWLIVEGLWRPAADGLLEIYRRGKWEALELGARRYTYKEPDAYLTTLEMKTGIRVRRTANRDETAHVIANLYRWWTNKSWEQHRSHLSLHRPADATFLLPPPLRRRIAGELPGIGHEKSAAVAAHFGSTRAMVNADEKEWVKVPGIGKTLAKRIVAGVESQ